MNARFGLWLVVFAACAACDVQTQDASPHAPESVVRYCSSCHAPPAPKVHPPEEWPNVVARMEIHMRQKGFPAIPDQDRAELLAYLQSRGK